jgi:hypothetical protein
VAAVSGGSPQTVQEPEPLHYLVPTGAGLVHHLLRFAQSMVARPVVRQVASPSVRLTGSTSRLVHHPSLNAGLPQSVSFGSASHAKDAAPVAATAEAGLHPS